MTESNVPYSTSEPTLCDSCIWSGKRVEATRQAIVPGGPRRHQTVRYSKQKRKYVKGDPIDSPYNFCDDCYHAYLAGIDQRDRERHSKWLRDNMPNQGTLF